MRHVVSLLVRVLVRLRPQRWCPPSISLRLFRLSAGLGRPYGPTPRVPGTTTRSDLSYAPGRDGLFDLVVPDLTGPRPLVLWIHGGGFYSGSKADVLPYLQQLAAHGYVGAAVNYPLAPRHRYPAAPRAIRQALDHLLENAAAYGIDPTRVVLAGDSAGALLAAELAASSPDRFRGVLLFCGTYDPRAVEESDRMFGAALASAMWGLLGTRRWREHPGCAELTVLERVTPEFPPTFLGAGTLDPLTPRQSRPMIARLTELGVPLDAFVPDAPTYHEFQFQLGTPPADAAFSRAVAFLERVASNSH